jgi:hypothetical protein
MAIIYIEEANFGGIFHRLRYHLLIVPIKPPFELKAGFSVDTLPNYLGVCRIDQVFGTPIWVVITPEIVGRHTYTGQGATPITDKVFGLSDGLKPPTDISLAQFNHMF